MVSLFEHIRKIVLLGSLLFSLTIGAGCQGSFAMVQSNDSCAIMKRYSENKILLDEGNLLIEKKEYLQAIELFDRGIASIGQSYSIEGVEDDTEMKFGLSNIEKSKGSFEISANLKSSVLSARLQEFLNGRKCKS